MQICYIIYINGIQRLGQGVISERGMFVNAICHSEEATVLRMYLYELRRVFLFTNECLTCLECMIETIRRWKIVPDMQYNLLQCNTYA